MNLKEQWDKTTIWDITLEWESKLFKLEKQDFDKYICIQFFSKTF